VAIVVRLDAGFFDQKLFRLFEGLGIGYLCGGKLQDDLRELARGMDPFRWSAYDNGHQLWQYFEFGDHRPSWRKTEWRRTFSTRPAFEDAQRLFEFARPDHQANAAFYYTVLVAFFLFETFKRDVTEEVVPSTVQATRVRREAIDFAAKIVRTSGAPSSRLRSRWGTGSGSGNSGSTPRIHRPSPGRRCHAVP